MYSSYVSQVSQSCWNILIYKRKFTMSSSVHFKEDECCYEFRITRVNATPYSQILYIFNSGVIGVAMDHTWRKISLNRLKDTLLRSGLGFHATTPVGEHVDVTSMSDMRHVLDAL